MPEIKKSRILIASVLKPVDDTRMFEKIGQTLVQLPGVEVHIFGYPARELPPSSTLTLHPTTTFGRLSFARILQPFKFLGKAMSLTPDIVVISTHELLLSAVLLKLVRWRTILIYDVQENYARNIMHTHAFPRIIRPIVASYVRMKEIVLTPFINHFLLAEKTYAEELSFCKNNHTIIENKVKKTDAPAIERTRNDKSLHLLFTGTLAESTGILNAIAFSKALHALDTSVRLTIAGYCSRPSLLNMLKAEIENHDFILLIGGDTLVPHTTILTKIQHCDFGLVANVPDRATQNRIPTKLYEYMGYKLPIVLTDHAPWMDFCKPYNAAISIDFATPNIAEILKRMKTTTFYTTEPQNVVWETEAQRLLQRFKILLK